MNRTELCIKIGASIRKYRLKADISQENLSLSAGLHPAYIGRLERGEKCPTIDTLYRISEALEISVLDLLHDEKEELASNEVMKSIEHTIRRIPREKQKDVANIIESMADLLE